MSYPRQDSVAARLQRMNVRAMARRADAMYLDVRVLWNQAARLLKADVAAAYQASSPSGGRWDLTALHSGNTYGKLSARIGAVLSDFLSKSKAKVRRSVNDLKSESAQRHAWVMAQVAPLSRHIKVRKQGMSEADVPLSSGFGERWDQWVSGYHEALLRNLRMNALNSGTVTDAIAEVDATRVDTPAYTLDAAMDRLWDYYAWEAVAGGMHQVVEDNPDGMQEIWRTSGDLRVCDDCDANEGLPIDEADGTIPLHPNCNCFPQLVPASYADLLRSGDEDDQDLARQMDAEGVAPNALVIRNEDGDIVGKTVVDFEDWANQTVSGGVQ